MNKEIELLKEIQRQSMLNGIEFTKKIGYNYINWSKVKYGKLPVSDTLRMKIILAFPEYREKILSLNANTISNEVNN